MSNVLKISGPVKVGELASAPSNPQPGYIYFNTSSGTFQMYENGNFREVSAEAIEAHLNGGASKHDATEVDYERSDGSKKNIDAGSDDVETALTDLDDAIGALAASPTNYTPSDASIVADHLAGIDTALASAGGDTFLDNVFRIQDNADNTKEIAFEASGIATGTTRTITMPNTNVDLGDIATNSAHAAGDGSDHADVAANTAHSTGDGSDHQDVADLVTLSGSAANSTNHGAFSGGTLGDTETTRSALQALETAVEARALDADVIKKDGSVAFTGDQSMGNQKLTNLAAPTADNDAARKVDVDNAAAGLDPKESVRLATTADLSATYSSSGGAGGTGQFTSAPTTIDGVAIAEGDRILVKDQTEPQENGLYVVTSTTSTWDRASDQDGSPSNEVSGGNFTFVEQGTANASSGWVVQGDGELTLNTDDIVWVQFSGAGQITAGDGLDKTGNTLSVNVDGDGIAISSDNLTLELDGSTLSKSASGLRVAALTADRALQSDGSGNLAASSVTSTELGYLSGVTSAIQTQLDAKLENVVEDTSPELGGDLDVGGFAIEDPDAELVLAGQNAVRRAKQASKSSFVEEEYIHSIALAGSQTGTTIAALTFAHATFEGCEISYKLKEATSSDVRIGTIRVVTNGTSVVLNDVSTETADTGIVFSAAVNGANIEIRYDSGTNGATMRADVKRIAA